MTAGNLQGLSKFEIFDAALRTQARELGTGAATINFIESFYY